MDTEKTSEPSVMGRPTKYKEEYDEQAYKLCLLGATDAHLASFFDVAIDTVNEWKKVHPNFSASIKRGKYSADAEIASSLYNRAKGMTITIQQAIKLTTKKQQINEDTGKPSRAWEQNEKIEVVSLENEIPPDTVAAIFWLKNRQPKEWRDKIEIDTNDGVFTPEERWNRIKELKEKLINNDNSLIE